MTADTDRTATRAIALGGVLIALGAGGYIASGLASVTALIPSILGLVVVALGAFGRRTDRIQIATYGIGAVGLFGVLGSVRGVPDIIALVTGDTVDSVVAPVSQLVTTLVCLALVGIAVQTVIGDR